jgi:hypothetical protein
MAHERIVLAGVGAAQGVAFWLLIENWPKGRAVGALFAGLLTFLSVATVVSHFAWTGRSYGRLLALACGTAGVYAAVAFWVGGQIPSAGDAFQGDDQRAFTWIVASLTTLYVLGPFLQIYQASGRRRFPYQALFLHSWNNFFVALVGLLFLGSLWAVLGLWAALFDLVEIDFFSELFCEELFVYTVSGGAAGLGIGLGRESQRVIETLRGITLAVFRILLPLTSFVALLFIATLPFTGLDPLWGTGHASPILLSWISLTVLFLNAVYQDGSGPPYPRVLARLVEASVVSMVLYATISLYGTRLRIGQHGLTPPRFYALLFGVILGLYAIGYAAAVLRRSPGWLAGIPRVNLVMALTLVALGLLLHTPVLDPLFWSARSQFTRLAEGRTRASDFDYGYLHFRLGRAGAARLAALEALEDHPEIASIREGIRAAREAASYFEWQRLHGPEIRPEDLTVYPPGTQWPGGLFDAIRRDSSADLRGCHEGDGCAVLPLNLDGKAGDEYAVLLGTTGSAQLLVFLRDELGAWRLLGEYQPADVTEEPDPATIRDAIRQSRIETRPSLYPDLIIDGGRFHLVPR